MDPFTRDGYFSRRGLEDTARAATAGQTRFFGGENSYGNEAGSAIIVSPPPDAIDIDGQDWITATEVKPVTITNSTGQPVSVFAGTLWTRDTATGLLTQFPTTPVWIMAFDCGIAPVIGYPPLQPVQAIQLDQEALTGVPIYHYEEPSTLFCPYTDLANFLPFTLVAGVSGVDLQVGSILFDFAPGGTFFGPGQRGPALELAQVATSPPPAGVFNGTLTAASWFGSAAIDYITSPTPSPAPVEAFLLEELQYPGSAPQPTYGVATGTGGLFALELGLYVSITTYNPTDGHEYVYTVSGGLVTQIVDAGAVAITSGLTGTLGG